MTKRHARASQFQRHLEHRFAKAETAKETLRVFIRCGGPEDDAAESGYASFLGRVMDSPNGRVFVAEDAGGVADYVYVALEPMSWKELRGPAGFIHDVAVREGSRRSGVAAQLMEAALEWLRERGAPRVAGRQKPLRVERVMRAHQHRPEPAEGLEIPLLRTPDRHGHAHPPVGSYGTARPTPAPA